MRRFGSGGRIWGRLEYSGVVGKPKEPKLIGETVCENTGLGSVPLIESASEESGIPHQSVVTIVATNSENIREKDMV